jgi:hypothetical protein
MVIVIGVLRILPTAVFTFASEDTLFRLHESPVGELMVLHQKLVIDRKKGEY